MFTLTRTTLVAIAATASVAVAFAQPPAATPRGPMHGPGMMGGSWNTTSYLDSLKGQLAITADQQPAWKDYADTVSGVGEQMQALHQTMFDAMGTASWQERRDMMNRMFDARQQSFDNVHAAAIKLLPSLDATQKAKAQQILPGLAARPGMMGMRAPAPR